MDMVRAAARKVWAVMDWIWAKRDSFQSSWFGDVSGLGGEEEEVEVVVGGREEGRDQKAWTELSRVEGSRWKQVLLRWPVRSAFTSVGM